MTTIATSVFKGVATHGERFLINVAQPVVVQAGDNIDYIEIQSGFGATIFGQASTDLIVGADNNANGGDTIYGDSGADDASNVLGAADFIHSRGGDDVVFAGVGNDQVVAGGGDDYVVGGAGNDTLWGGTGRDTILGGVGDDVIYGATASAQPQEIFIFTYWDGLTDLEFANPIELSIASVIGLTPLTPNDTTGDFLYGGDGNDYIVGANGADHIEGNDGNDTLIGGLASDVLNGGLGNDYYMLGAEATGIDAVIDGGGVDTINSTITRSLASFPAIERLTLSGAGLANGTGNGSANIIVGNVVANVLAGGLGNDILSGGGGNDKLIGGPGIDTLTGGANLDIFVFNTAPNPVTNRDIISDFSHVDDTFQLENAVFTKLGAQPGAHQLNPAFFRAGAAALDANDYIVYNRANGVLSYDTNGNANGGAIAFAVLVNKPVLAANDFVVI